MIKKLQKHFVLVLVISAIIAMAISLAIGLMQSVWFDEGYSIIIAKQPVSELIRLTSLDAHPPFYYLLLKGWASVFGWSELALRSLSVLSMGGAIIFAGFLIKKMFDSRTSIFTLPFVVFAPFLLRYGFEIRMYALGSMIGIAATYVLVKALDSKDKRLFFLYGFLVALGVYTLYYMVLLWFAHLIWLIWLSKKNNQQIFKSGWFKSYILSVIFFLPWLTTFLHQITNGALASITQSMTIGNFFGIISFSFVYRPVWQLNAILSAIVMFVFFIICYLTIKVIKIADRKQKQYIMLLGLYIIVPIAILTLVGLFYPMYVERYLTHVLIGASLYIGVASALIFPRSKRLVKIAILSLVPIMVIGIIQLIQVGNYNFQRLQHIETKLAASNVSCNDNEKIIAADPYTAIEFKYYLADCPLYFYSDTADLRGGYAPLANSNLRISNSFEQLAGSKTIYYIYYGEPRLQMPTSLTLKTQLKLGALTVEKFSDN